VKVAYVVPRYGLEVLGGAEFACRMLAERLVALAGWDVHVFTTCAVDAQTWANQYTAGNEELNGVSVHRYSSIAGRSLDFHEFASALLARPEIATAAECDRFIDLQGPVCPDAVDAAVDSNAQLLIFYPYLFYPTARGVSRAGARAVMHPAAHDEPALRLPIFRDVFAHVRGLVYHTTAERILCEQLFDVGRTRQVVLGLGVDEHDRDAGDVGRTEVGLGDEPFLLYVGRLEDGKGTTALAEMFAGYKRENPGPLKLVLAGPVANSPPRHADIVMPGAVSDDGKRSLMAQCLAFVQPSLYESFSLVLIEAWLEGAPAIVNGRCSPLREHCERSGGGVWFDDDATFAQQLSRVVDDEPLRKELGQRGQDYVRRHFTWPNLIERYQAFLTGVTPRRSRAAARRGLFRRSHDLRSP
jgi:glycosyltransferase involved in cell wall biosynthesis